MFYVDATATTIVAADEQGNSTASGSVCTIHPETGRKQPLRLPYSPHHFEIALWHKKKFSQVQHCARFTQESKNRPVLRPPYPALKIWGSPRMEPCAVEVLHSGVSKTWASQQVSNLSS